MKWTSIIDDGLPEPDREYLVYDGDGDMAVMRLLPTLEWMYEYVVTKGNDYDVLEGKPFFEVTHCMSLPESPK